LSRSGIRSLAANAGYIFGTRALGAVLRGVYAILLARYLGPETYGLFNYGLSWYLAFLPLTFWGMNIIMSREVGRDRHGEGARVVDVSAGARFFTTIVAASLCVGVGMLFEDNPEAKTLIVVFTLALVGRSVATWVNDVFAAHERASYILRIEGSFRVLETIFGMALLFMGYGIWAAVAVHLISWWLQALGGLVVLRRRVTLVRPQFARSELLSLLRTGLPLAIMGFFTGWLMQGPLVLYRHVGEDQHGLGQLALALQFTAMLSQVISSISIAALPIMSRSIDRGDQKDVLFVVWMMRLGVIFAASAAILGTVAGPWVLSLLFAGTYDLTGHLLGPALWLLVPFAAASGLRQRLLAQRKDTFPMIASIGGAIAMFAAAPVCIHAFGPVGAIYAGGLGRIASVSIIVAALIKLKDTRHIENILRLITALSITVIAFYLLLPSHPLLAATVTISVLLVSNYVFVLSPSDRASVISLFRKTVGKD
jgi:O-antigen/teichoic acid export membrane protein